MSKRDGGLKRFGLLVACLLLSGGAWAQVSGGLSNGAFPLVEPGALFIPNWFSMVLVGLALAVGLIAAAFMFGEAFSLPSAKSFARQEVYELMISILLVALVVGGLYGFGIFAKNVSGGTLTAGQTLVTSGYCMDSERLYPTGPGSNPENSLYASADWFLGCMPTDSQGSKFDNVQNGVKLPYDQAASSTYASALWPEYSSKGVLLGHLMNIYIGLFTLELPLGTVSTFGVSFYLPEALASSISLDLAPHSGLSPISEITITLTDLIGVGIGMVFTQKILLQFFHQNALAIFLPLGIAFRAVPFLRKTGSTIIAAALVMYFIFPLSIWVNEQVYFSMQGRLDTSTNPPTYEHPVLTDWVNYHTLLQMCNPQDNAERADSALMRQRLRNDIAKPYVQDAETAGDIIINDVWGPQTDANGNPVNVRLPISQGQALLRAFTDNSLLMGRYLVHEGFILGPILPVDTLYTSLVDQITVSAQWFVLTLLFMINTLVISITIFRDVSLAIGGEPRIFGLSKLV